MVISVDNICKTFGTHKVLTDVSFDIDDSRGEYVYLHGDSGSGKTTLLNIIAGMFNPDMGNVYLDGKDISTIKNYRNKFISYVPCGNCLIESLTVRENILLVAGDQSTDYLFDTLDRLHVTDTQDSYPRKLSSGEYKRVCLARSIVANTPFLLLDEPTSNLDRDSADIIVSIISELKKTKGIILATHDDRLMRGREICIE